MLSPRRVTVLYPESCGTYRSYRGYALGEASSDVVARSGTSG